MATSSTTLTMAEQLVPDELWAAIQPLLPPKPPHPKGGRPWIEDRAVLDRHPVRCPAPSWGRARRWQQPSPNGDRALGDVLELAAVTTLIKGGTVYVLPAGEVPGGGVSLRSSAIRPGSFGLSNWLKSGR
jgi:hypothetical protein